ncbi:hypothetical protein OK074_3239 [Actinobacteria bacterium OK074]|nr:hypothetical protein OK074_3239 [Actinobacteria bacterium OK074]
MHRRTVTAATALAVLFSSAALTVGTAGSAAADSSKVLPVTSVQDMVADGVHHRVFISAGNKIVVTDYSGTVVSQITDLLGVKGLALSADSDTLYAAVSSGTDAIVAIDTATATLSARYPTGGVDPKYPALAGGKLWFGYGSAGEGNIGSVDLADPAHTVALAQDPDSPWFAAPMLAATPNAPDTLAAGIPQQSPAELAVYDTSSGALSRTAHSDVNGGNLIDLAITPDGKDVVVASGAPYYQAVYKTSDLTADGQYPTNAYPNAVDIAPDGSVAAGIDGAYDPDVYVFKPGSHTAVHTYDFPSTSSGGNADLLTNRGLAWAPDSSRVFATSYNYDGVYRLRVLTDPTKPVTTLTVNAPKTATRAKKLTVSGKVTSKAGIPAGAKLTVTRTDLERPNGSALASVTVKADGTYSFTDTPLVGGDVKYTVKYAGDTTHAAGSGTDTVAVSRVTPALTLSHNGKVYDYGKDVKFTAHLGPTYKNRTVAIYANPDGSDKPNKLVKSAKVNSAGNLSVTLDLKRNTKVTVKYTGDARYKSRTVTSTVGARVKVTLAVARQYTTKKISGHTYYYFHKTTKPVFTTTMPPYSGRKQRLAFEVYYEGAWRDGGYQYFKLNTAGVSKVELPAQDTGYRFRVRSSYLKGSSGDSVNSTTHGAWRYFTFTK